MVMSPESRRMMAQRAMQRDAERQERHDTFMRRAKKTAKVAILSALTATAGWFGVKGVKKAAEAFSSDNNQAQTVQVSNSQKGKQLVRHEVEVIEKKVFHEKVIEKKVPVYVVQTPDGNTVELTEAQFAEYQNNLVRHRDYYTPAQNIVGGILHALDIASRAGRPGPSPGFGRHPGHGPAPRGGFRGPHGPHHGFGGPHR